MTAGSQEVTPAPIQPVTFILLISLKVIQYLTLPLHQKFLAAGGRYLLQQRPRAAVLRVAEVRAENVLQAFHASL